MDRRYYTQAEGLVETVSDLQKQVLVKHTALILEEIHDQIKARDAEIERLRDAVQATLDVVHSWHGQVGWGIYLRNAPELQNARDALRIVTPNGPLETPAATQRAC